ncbi:MAG: HNH endonuclease signature motif containing protein [Armatimonadaceae bacterium]
MSQSYIPVALARLVTERARGQCEYCRCLSGFHSDPFAIEHIVPEALGGATEEANLALSCLGCNSFKGAFVTGYDPITNTETELFHPRQQMWTEHFVWSADTTQILGLTASGRATVERLRLNRPGLVNLRAALRHFGVHPPEP